MGQGLHLFQNAIDKTPGTTGSWQTVTLSDGDGVPSGATGAVLFFTSVAYVADIGVRPIGSSRSPDALRDSHGTGAFVKLNASRQFEAYIFASSQKVWLIGYADSDVEWLSDFQDVTPATAGAWTDMDLSSYISSGAKGCIFYIWNGAGITNEDIGVRKNGTTDSVLARLHTDCQSFLICACDASRIVEGYITTSGDKIYLLGAFKSTCDVFFKQPLASITSDNTSTWIDRDLTSISSENAVAAIIFTKGYYSWQTHGVRANGSVDAFNVSNYAYHAFCVGVLLDSEEVTEIYSSNTNVTFQLVAYFEAGAGPILIEVTDSLGLGDAVLRDRTFAVSDGIGLSDALLRDKAFAITDQLGLSDTLLGDKTLAILDTVGLQDSLLRDKTFSVSDTISLSDLLLALKTLAISDSISLSDLVDIITEILKEVLDSISLSDSLLTNKSLMASDVIGLADSALVNKILLLLDVVSTLEQVLANKQLNISDLVALADLIETIGEAIPFLITEEPFSRINISEEGLFQVQIAEEEFSQISISEEEVP